MNLIGLRGRVLRSTAQRITVRLLAMFAATILSSARADQPLVPTAQGVPSVTTDDMRMVAPALATYTQEQVLGELWHRPGLSPRDRSIITVAALIARNQTVEMSYYFNLALDSGVKPAELSGIITHLAFYSGWANAMSAVAVAKTIFKQRGIGPDQLPSSSPKHLPLDPSVEARRAASVDKQFGSTFPGLVQDTTDVLFHDLWLRPDLSPRDRSLVTVSALIASGEFAQLPSHLNRAMNNGLTRGQAAEMITQLAFYAGWPNAFSAAPLVKTAIENHTN